MCIRDRVSTFFKNVLSMIWVLAAIVAVSKRIVSSSLIFIIGECLLIHCLDLIFYKSTDIS